MPEITMPRLSDTMQEGTITRWLKKAGDEIKKGDILAEIETDKANMEVESYDNGVLQQILVQEGETAPIGQPIALLSSGKGSEAVTQPQQARAASESKPREAKPATTTADEQAPEAPPSPQYPQGSQPVGEGMTLSTNGTTERLKVSPLARRIAEEHGIDLRQIHGTGPGGRIVRDDLEDYLQQQRTVPTPTPQPQTVAAPSAPAVSQPEEEELRTLTSMQKTIARRLSESKQTIPHFYVSGEIDMTDMLSMRQMLNSNAGEEGVKVSVNDLIVKACALALEKFPEVNSSFRDGQFVLHKHINIGIAIDIPNGLVVPVIRDANIKGVRTIAREAKALIEKARTNKLTTTDLSGGTFSISNLGMMDVTDFAAIINPPEVAILAISTTRKTFVPVDGQPVIRNIMPMTISADHRVLYGATAARFLQEVKRLLQNPYALLG
ncbi:pyruvate dehydrogenase complex dihydrolipoamide acetyltransferase [Ktedonosporobacter rubrisoli]|uniref:Acetyltransferase component of pyruvate dehydrogenase complex n=1 Tax=Ktedonosporobacter rubrisoli TaxID=2509675 RepID=A0A4P6K0T2_KTERU|nr:pyruvate dehydrogenase complex dihydrolipoamide acetyltransferase [Ktedonosporobacter rubrisoli]QBD81669.1 pyruvate dehydrogenase complex dihydrolipoamide acetyltransferase [Ktedonosporobacter rubrisoli]